MAFLNKGLTITLPTSASPKDVDEVAGTATPSPLEAAERPGLEGQERTFHYPGGFDDFVKHINRAKTRSTGASSLLRQGRRP